MLRVLAIAASLTVLTPGGQALASRVKIKTTMRPPQSGPRPGLGTRIKRAFFGRRGEQKAARARERQGADVEHDRWMSVYREREPTRTRSPFEHKLADFRPRSGPHAHNRGASVKGIGARAVWIDAEVALLRTDTGPDLFLPTRELDASTRERLTSGGKVKVDVVYHATGGVVATSPRVE